ncbi:hypothetical protein D4764_21G0005030 [Takifugu flavidus]|uniref:Uncharacterized protein n=1 Tax=Takifugu flavidus TaxID=433684 RepID=A0A5C6NEK0_9TELE|nr:hypothetical protein D4764_21G0005030 [Takifugu flavidus]
MCNGGAAGPAAARLNGLVAALTASTAYACPPHPFTSVHERSSSQASKCWPLLAASVPPPHQHTASLHNQEPGLLKSTNTCPTQTPQEGQPAPSSTQTYMLLAGLQRFTPVYHSPSSGTLWPPLRVFGPTLTPSTGQHLQRQLCFTLTARFLAGISIRAEVMEANRPSLVPPRRPPGCRVARSDCYTTGSVTYMTPTTRGCWRRSGLTFVELSCFPSWLILKLRTLSCLGGLKLMLLALPTPPTPPYELRPGAYLFCQPWIRLVYLLSTPSTLRACCGFTLFPNTDPRPPPAPAEPPREPEPGLCDPARPSFLDAEFDEEELGLFVPGCGLLSALSILATGRRRAGEAEECVSLKGLHQRWSARKGEQREILVIRSPPICSNRVLCQSNQIYCSCDWTGGFLIFC